MGKRGRGCSPLFIGRLVPVARRFLQQHRRPIASKGLVLAQHAGGDIERAFPGIAANQLQFNRAGFSAACGHSGFRSILIGGLVLPSIGGNEYRARKNLCRRAHLIDYIVDI